MDWAKIKTEYITTDTSYRELGEKYGVHYQTICARSRKEGWIQEREQHQNRTVTKSVKNIENKKSRQAAKVCALADKLLGKLEQSIDELDFVETTHKIKKVTGNGEETTEFKVASEGGTVDRAGLRQLAAALKDLQIIKGELTSLERREREARIALLRRQAEPEQKETATLIVEGLPEEFKL